MAYATNRNLPLLHRFQESSLRLGRSTVDFIRQYDVAENGAFQETTLSGAGGSVFFQDIRPGNICRHQVGRELNTTERQV